jgi:hypothetical protein
VRFGLLSGSDRPAFAVLSYGTYLTSDDPAIALKWRSACPASSAPRKKPTTVIEETTTSGCHPRDCGDLQFSPVGSSVGGFEDE